MSRLGVLLGAAGALGARAGLRRALLVKFRQDVAAVNGGNYEPLLAGYHPDAVLHFNDADHRWAGVHRGKPAIERFLQDFARAGITGEIVDVWFSGWPWAMTLVARFDDGALAPDGRRIYENRTVLVVRTRWGRIVEQHDFYEDTTRILAFERELRALGIDPV